MLTGMRFVIAAACCLLASCMGLKGTKHTYLGGPPVKVAGAEVAMGFRPEGTRPGSVMVSAMVVGGGVATFDGPFEWRVVAIGEEGRHESLAVHRIRTRTEKTGRDEWFPASELGRRADFRPWKGHPGKVRARYPIPGLLKVMPETDGRLDVWVDLTVRENGRATRQTVRFALDPTVKAHNEVVFLPTEIVEGITTAPEDWEDPMWD